MIVSDVYDTVDPDRLAAEIRRLRRRCRRIIWLNPLIGWRDYRPQARGMQAALPYVDLFAPAHNLESLAALGPCLARIFAWVVGPPFSASSPRAQRPADQFRSRRSG